MKGETALEKILSRLESEDRGDGQYQAHCPAHDDKKPSLSITEAEPGGKVLLYCQAGCATEDVLGALNLSWQDLFPGDGVLNSKGKDAKQGKEEATYDYTDEEGKLKYQVVRYEPKGFAQRHPDGRGGWLWDLKGMKKVPYRLPEVIKAIKEGRQVFIVEGEKDADNLVKMGFTATTNSGGAGKWTEEHAKWLQGAEVVIIPDNDEPGRKHARQVAESLQGLTKFVKIIELQGLPLKGDVSDWIEAGGTAQSLLDLAEATGDYEADIADITPKSGSLAYSDLGNAKRFVREFAERVKYCNDWGTWLIFDGRKWEKDRTLQIEDMAKTIPACIHEEASRSITPEERMRIAKHALKSESAYSIKEMLKLAASDPTIAITHEAFDKDLMMLNVLNGVVDLRSGKLVDHDPNFMMTKLAPTEYNLEASSEVWDNFIKDVTGGDEELIKFIQKSVGYSLTGNTSENVLFFVYGPTATGKSTFLEAVKSVLGDYAKTADFESFLKRNGNSGPRDDVAILEGARMVVSVEVDEGKRLAEGLIKQLTGGDTIACRPLYKSTIQFVPAMKLWMAANHKPKVSAEDGAMWGRIRMLPFDRTIPLDKREPALKARLKDTKETGPAILAWAVKGCLMWQQEGLKAPKRVNEATDSYRQSQDIIGDFIEAYIEACEGETLPRSKVYEAYKEWCDKSGERSLTQTTLTQKLLERGWKEGPRGRERTFAGYKLKKTEYPDDGQEETSIGASVFDRNEIEKFNEVLSEEIDFMSDNLDVKH